MSRFINYICIILGAIVAIYSQAEIQQNTYILIGGIVLLVFGIYRIAKHVPSKSLNENEEDIIKNEDI